MSTRRLLVADDEEPVRRLLARFLAAPDREVITAHDGARALELAAHADPDLVVLDVRMPRRSGWEVLSDLRRRARTRLTPVVMLTGEGDDAAKVYGFDRGADDYVTKPFNGEVLAARVAGLLRRHAQAVAANPLTGLPGNPAIAEELTRLIAAGEGFALFHADLDRFKPFNDERGFAEGDRVLLRTSEILREACAGAFVGHVGGDDFVAVCPLDEAPLAAQRLATAFDAAAKKEFPGLTLSIGVATTATRAFATAAEASAVAGEMKSYLKLSAGVRALSAFAFDRRTGPRPAQES